MKTKERVFQTVLIILAIAVSAIPAIYASATGYYFSETESKLLASLSHLLLIGALLIGINRNPKSKPSKIGAISGLTVLMLLRWF